MAYGETMRRLSPCPDEFIGDVIADVNGRPQSILDVGCGRGERLAYLKHRFPDMLITGIDSDMDNADTAAKLLTECGIKFADATSLPFKDEVFDTVLCECTFSLFDNPEKSLGEMLRVMQHGGRLILADICTDEESVSVHNAPDGETIRKIYSRPAIERIAAEAGFCLRSYFDRSCDLTEMAAQMIFDGSFCSCVGKNTAKMLFELRVGYGVWIFAKD